MKVDGKRLAVILSAVKAYTDSEQKDALSPGMGLESNAVTAAGNGHKVPIVKAPLNMWGIAGRQEIMLQRTMVQLDAYSRI